MNIKSLQKLLNMIDDIAPIGKNTEIDGVIYHVMGLTRMNDTMRMVVLHYDEAYVNKMKELEEAQLEAMHHDDDINREPETNRKMLNANIKNERTNPFMDLAKVKIHEEEFQVTGAESRWISSNDIECVLMLTEFLRKGWKAEGINHQMMEELFITSIEFQGDCNVLPSCDENTAIEFYLKPCMSSYRVEQAMTLVVGEEYPEKLWFNNKETQENHWVQINRVYLQDMWKDLLETFENPRIKEMMTPEQIEVEKQKIEEKLSEICPKGMCFPVVEYESEQEISLRFYSKEYLDAQPIHRNGALGFITRPEQVIGKLGFRLRASIIEQPVLQDTVMIQAELFQYSYLQNTKDIILM